MRFCALVSSLLYKRRFKEIQKGEQNISNARRQSLVNLHRNGFCLSLFSVAFFCRFCLSLTAVAFFCRFAAAFARRVQERERSAWPYRVLARTAEDYDDDQEERFVVLKREPNHFVLLEMLLHPSSSDEKSSGGAASTASLSKLSKALFLRSELPDVVRRLWKMDSAEADV